MKTMMIAGLLAILPTAQAMASEVGDVAESKLYEYRETVKNLAAGLKSALEEGIASGGPAAAVGICQTKALLIAQEYSARKGWKVGRTSLKTRNPNNAPDEWEQAVLTSFEQRKAQGENPAMLEEAKIVEENGEYKIR
jgi:hypothetical protein